MKRKFIFLVMLFALLGGVNWNVLNAQNVVSIGEGSSATYSFLPCYTYYNHSVAQQIYTAEELTGLDGNIISMSFQTKDQAPTRTLSVYMINTDKEEFENPTDMVNLSENDKVFTGSVTYTFNGWTTITFDTPFAYAGKNLLLCVNDHTGNWVSSPANYVYDAGEKCRAIWYYQDNYAYDLSNISNNSQGSYKTSTAYHGNGYYCNSQIRFTYEAAEPGVKVNTESIALGTTMLGTYWNEKETPSASFEAKATQTTITSISCDNDFFTLSYDMTTNPVVVNVTYNKDANVSGLQEGTITISAEGVEDATVAVSATAYAPVTPDVIELAQEVEFTSGAYENTPDFATLYDDYNLPKEAKADSTPDAVYHFTMEEGILTVNVTGTNAVAAIYKAEDLEGSGPMANNNFKGIVAGPSAPTTFFYDFAEESSFEDFNTRDDDEDGRNWEWYNGSIISYSWNGADFYPQNYIFTKEVYAITETSELIYKYRGGGYADNYAIVISEDGVNFEHVAEQTVGKITTLTDVSVDLSKHAGKVVHIGLYHYNSIAQYYVNIDNLQLTDGSDTRSRSLARNAEPQINGVLFPAGEYYLVAAAEDDFTVSIETGALPAPGEFAYTAPADGATEQNNPKLTWEAAQYATKYQVFLGTESTELELVAEVETPSYQTEGLLNNTQYFWSVDAVNSVGTEKGTVYSFVTPLDVPQNLVATNIYEGETATLTWDAIENVTYNVYVDGEKVNTEPITATSYELTGLAYNLSGYNVTVTAVHTLGESPKSAAVNVKVAGKFTLVLNVKDAADNAIVGATVDFNTESFLNEFYELVPAIEAMTTNTNGMISIELPLPCQYYPDYQYSSVGAIVSKEFYRSSEVWVDSWIGLTNGQEYVVELTLNLVAPEALAANEYQFLVGDTLVMTWDAVDAAIGYNVYKQGEWNEETYSYDYEQLNEEMLSDTTYTIYGVEYGMYVQYAVTAVYAELGESSKTSTSINVTGMGEVSGTVTDDDINPIKGVKVVLTGYDETYTERTYTFTTDAEGQFSGKVMVGYNYTATATRYDYEDKEETEIEVEYGETTYCTIVMTSYPSATIDVTATVSGDNAVVSWTADYERYNVYRRNVETDAIEELATETTSEEYTDTQWASLENGTYQYGVSAFVDGGSSRGAVVVEGFENSTLPEGWYSYTSRTGATASGYIWKPVTSLNNGSLYPLGNYAACSNTAGNQYSGNWYLVAPLYDLTGIDDPKLTFSYYTPYYNAPTYTSSAYTNKLTVLVSTTSQEGPWSDPLWSNNQVANTSWTEAEVDLTAYKGQKVYIAFCTTANYGRCSAVDNVYFPAGNPQKESVITWSNELVKKSALTLTFDNANGTGNNDWNNAANWVGGVLPTADDNVVVAAVANIDSTVVAVNNLTIKANLNLKAGAVFTVNGTITLQSGYLYLEDGSQIFQSNEGVNALYRMSIKNPTAWSTTNKDGWQFISSPLLNSDITVFATKYNDDYQSGFDFDIYKYDGSQDAEWVNYKRNTFALEMGQGYMYSHQARTIVTLNTGTLNPARTNTWELTYDGDKALANLHLLGNPFTFNMDWAEVNVTNVHDGFATLNAAGNNYVYAVEGTIPVGDGFFVQAMGENPTMTYGMRGSREKSANINVIARGNTGEDNVIINFAGEGEGFRKLQGFNEDNARIFVANDDISYGIYNCDRNVSEVELSFIAAQMGNYSISFDVNGKFESVVLVDRFTGVETNMLLEDEYSFTATSNDSHNRFVVRLGSAKIENANFVYQSGDELIIDAEGAIEIIDMMGRVVYRSEMNNGRVNVSEFNNAAYVVRALNEGKVQKVVIY